MASATYRKNTGILRLLLLGLLLPSVLVSGQDANSTTSMPSNSSTSTNTTQSPSTMTTGGGMNGTTMMYSTPMSMIYCPSFTCNYSDCYTMYCSQNATACAPGVCYCQLIRQTDMLYTVGCVASCADSCINATQTNCSVNCCNSTGCLNSTFTSMMMMMTTTAMTTTQSSSATTQSSTTTTQSSTTTTQSSTTTTQSSSSTSMTSYTGSTTSMMTNSTSNSTGGTTGTTMYSTPMSMIYCPSFTCNYSDCYTMYNSQNETACAAGVCWCQLIRQTDMCYTVGCVASCADSCINATQTNCSVDCCNSTGCLNSTFASMMMMTTTVIPTTTTTPTPATTTTSPQTTADNGNKCHRGTCTGTDCYTGFLNAAVQTCSSSEPHCQLKKETIEAGLQWTAGCITNCSDETPCKTSTKPPCHLECCNATMTSCLWLNGTLHVPNFATRGPHLHTELMASLLCLLAITLLL